MLTNDQPEMVSYLSMLPRPSHTGYTRLQSTHQTKKMEYTSLPASTLCTVWYVSLTLTFTL